MRIVSLLPSATEIVALLEAGEHLVGRSHECDFPTSILHAPVLTAQRTHYAHSDSPDPAHIDAAVKASLAAGQSLYTLDTAALAALKPDVIITQDLCHVCSIDLETVRRAAAVISQTSPAPAVISLNPGTLEQVFDDIITVGRAIRRESAAQSAVVKLRERMHTAQEYVNPYDDQVGVAFLEWTDPLFAAGHWTPQLIERAGGRHDLNPTIAAADAGSASGPQMAYRTAGKSIQITPEALINSNPKYIIICPCGMNLPQTRACANALLNQSWFATLSAVQAGRVALVDGNQYFNRPGPRLVDAFEFLVGWMQNRPELVPRDFAWEQLPTGKIQPLSGEIRPTAAAGTLPYIMSSSHDELLKRITQRPGQCGGRPCVRGMRIRVSDMIELIAGGMSQSEILADYPYLEADDIRACLIFASLRVSHTEIAA